MMNCKEAQEYLSDLLDRSLSVERAQEIEDHLNSCSPCSEEMARLAECQRLVSSLPEVEPPIDFTNRVMAGVHEAANPPSLWERLLLPLRIHIPLQATALVLVAVLAAYIYQKEEPVQREPGVTFEPESSLRKQENPADLAPSVTQVPSSDAKTKEVAEETRPRGEEFRDSAPGRGRQSLSRPAEQDKGIAGSFQENRFAKSEPASPRLEQSSPSVEAQPKGAVEPALQPEKENASKDAVPLGKSLSPEKRQRSAASSLDSLGSSTIAGASLPADHELAVRLSEPGRNAIEDRVASGAERHRSFTQEEAESLAQARGRAIRTGQPQIVQVTIARGQYELFKKELADVGTIEMESSTTELKNDPISKSSDRVRIKVTVLPPLAAPTPVPSQPSSR
ncbi:MAG TPA: DUF2275 domain-containing protein [Candidatus Binatia bacterium]|nr:DUF2275 domain-containing protein [Candidatus Binatia bacterium]